MAPREVRVDVCVVGGGPAGASLARRLQGLGHSTVVVEREAFPRRHVGESLSGSVVPLLDVLGVRDAVLAEGLLRPAGAIVRWGGGETRRSGTEEGGFNVDRGRFDAILARAAAQAGALFLQPARVVATRRRPEGGWSTLVRSSDGETTVRSRFLADASGRPGLFGGRRRRPGARTIALFAYWRDVPLEGAETRVEAGESAWYWGAPLPSGEMNVAVFVEAATYRDEIRRAGGRAPYYHGLLARSALLAGCADGRRVTDVYACDATPAYHGTFATPDRISVGEAAFCVDPLSSQGVAAAVGSALHGATVIHTIATRPDDAALAIGFYRSRVLSSVRMHSRAAARFYAEAARAWRGAFWAARAVPGGAMAGSPLRTGPAISVTPSTLLTLGEKVRFTRGAAVRGDLIVPVTAVHAPALAAPTAFVGNVEVVPLLRCLDHPATVVEVLDIWSRRLPLAASTALLQWALERRVLSPCGVPGSRCSATAGPGPLRLPAEPGAGNEAVLASHAGPGSEPGQ